ncbi:MAG: lysophospholipid acyltransferase family protein [Bacteroidales bacterium]
MIEAKHSWFYHLFFKTYFRYILRKDFKAIHIEGKFPERDMPILLIGNHFSWWDGFFAYELNRRIFKRRIYLMMLEEQLKKRSFFSKLGAFSINPGNRSALQSMNYASELLRHSSNLLILFPQGEIESQYNQKIYFRKGWFRILENAGNPVHIVFMANLTDYFSNRKPTLFIYLEEYPETGKIVFDNLNNSYNDFYNRCVERQKQLA